MPMATLTYHTTDIRNIALAGHGASAKTSLVDALLFAAGETARLGSVDEGTSLSDVEDEERRRHFTIDSHLLHLEWEGKQVHLIDSPGYPDFIGSALGALNAVENVLVTVSAPAGIEVNTRRIFHEAGKLGPRPVHRPDQDGRRQRRLPRRPRSPARGLRTPVRPLQPADRPGRRPSGASSTRSTHRTTSPKVARCTRPRRTRWSSSRSSRSTKT